MVHRVEHWSQMRCNAGCTGTPRLVLDLLDGFFEIDISVNLAGSARFETVSAPRNSA